MAMRNLRVVSFLCLVIAGVATAGLAQQLDLDALAQRPDFQVTRKDGDRVIEVRKNSVVISKGRDRILGMDEDRAVLCAWNEYVNLFIGAEYCFPDSERELREDFADAIERFKTFIVANSLTPVSRSDLDASVEKRRADFLARVPKTPPGTPRCVKLDFFADYQADGQEKRRADVTRILAVPRPPVMNPCL
jgi:hypothetical protein